MRRNHLDYQNTSPILPASLTNHSEIREELLILHIEDKPEDAALVRRYLESTHEATIPFRITNADSLRGGIESLRNADERDWKPFDAILLDLSLPDSSGFETFEAIHANAEDTPIIVLSGHDDQEFALNLVKKGAQDYLLKQVIGYHDILARSIYSAVERKRILTENKQLLDQLIQAEKLKSLGRIAAGVAHEVKNPLATVQMGVAYITSQVKEAEMTEVANICTEVSNAAQRAVGIISGMVDFSRDDSVSLEATDLGRVVDVSLDILKYEITKGNVTMNLEKEDNLPSVLLDPSKIEQVIINLVRNSIQAMADSPGKAIQIKTYSQSFDSAKSIPNLQKITRGQPAGEIVTLEMSDAGPGIPEEKLSLIFEPFFTTKEKGKGSGLGLSVVFHIIDLHNGLIQVNNVSSTGGLRTRIHFKALPT